MSIEQTRNVACFTTDLHVMIYSNSLQDVFIVFRELTIFENRIVWFSYFIHIFNLYLQCWSDKVENVYIKVGTHLILILNSVTEFWILNVQIKL